jgi:Fe-S-cluster-containing dehydrogenase component
MDRRTFLKYAGWMFSVLVAGLSLSPGTPSVLAKANEKTGKPTGKRWGMVVSLSACSKKKGCTDCIEACHRIHNVPSFGNPKDEVKWIWTAPFKEVFPDQSSGFSGRALEDTPLLVLCNHCENPPCVTVCPTKATFKRSDGIVMMDFHRCIGCRYCMAACPYGARSFNWRDPRPFIKEVSQDFPTRTKGVVEKCNFCEERLVRGLLPACVEACKEKALIFGDLNREGSEIRKTLDGRFSMQRKPHLGTGPKVFYVL